MYLCYLQLKMNYISSWTPAFPASHLEKKNLDCVFIIHLNHLFVCFVFFIGTRAGMEDRSEAASDDLQTADCRDHWGENLPQVRMCFSCFFFSFWHMILNQRGSKKFFCSFSRLVLYYSYPFTDFTCSWMLVITWLIAHITAVLLLAPSQFSVIEKLSCIIKWPI